MAISNITQDTKGSQRIAVSKQEMELSQADLAYIELTLSMEVRRQGSDPTSRLAAALIKSRTLIERCNGCLRMGSH